MQEATFLILTALADGAQHGIADSALLPDWSSRLDGES
jgi:hypothetical protein